MYNKILIPLDLEHIEMFKRAIAVAEQLFGEAGGEIHSLYVDQTRIHGTSFTQLSSEVARHARKEALRHASHIFQKFVPVHLRGDCRIANGVVYDEILEEEARIRPDLILIAAGKPGVSSYLLGSNAEKVLRHARGSVFVLRDEERW